MGLNGSPKRLKLRKTLHLADSIRCGNRFRENPPPGTNSDVTVRIIPGVSHSLLPDPVGPNSGWVYLPAFATSPQLLDVMTSRAATHLLTSSRKDKQR